MPKKKKAVDTKATRVRGPGNALLTNSLTNLLVTWIVAGALLAYLLLVQLPAESSAQIYRITTSYALQQSNLLVSATNLYRQQVRSLAQNPATIEQLNSLEQQALLDASAQAGKQFPNALSLQFIRLGPLGIVGLTKENISLRNNIEVDMIRLLSQNEEASVEAYQHNGEWLVSIAEPVVDPATSKVIGAVFLSIRNDFIIATLNLLDTSLGETKLLLTKGKQRMMAHAGSAGNEDYKELIDTDIPGWQISFTPSPATITANTLSPLVPCAAIGILALLISLLIIYGYQKVNSQFNTNFELLKNFIASLQSKPGSTAPGFTLTRFPEIARLCAELASSFKASAQTKAPRSSGGDVLELDTSTDFSDVLTLDDDLDVSSIEQPELNEAIFRAYDIRGIAGQDLTEATVYHIGLAIASEALAQDQTSIAVGYDGRHSSPELKNSLVRGLCEAGVDVIDIGLVPTPLLYFATNELETQSGVMITGSHNPPEYNGFKVIINGNALAMDEIQQLKQRILSQNYASGHGQIRQEDLSEHYIETIISDVAIAQPLKVVLDCGNGAASELAPRLVSELGCEVIPLYCEIDGDFPNHHPDPSIMDNLQDLIARVESEGADLGIAFDGDGDRLGVVSAHGNVILPDRLLMLFAQDVVSRNPGADVIFDIKSTRHLNSLISSYGGRPIMWKSGHSYIKQKMRETGALLGGELSGHIFFKERWYGFDDGIYSAARLIEILSTTDADLDNQLSAFPQSLSTPEITINVAEDRKFKLIEELIAAADLADAKISDLDGLRADFPDGWGLIRASNTTPKLTLRFEADDEEALARIQGLFRDMLLKQDSSLDIPF